MPKTVNSGETDGVQRDRVTETVEQDEIIREVRANREAYAAEFGYDIRALFEDAKRYEGKDGREVVYLEPRIVARETTEK